MVSDRFLQERDRFMDSIGLLQGSRPISRRAQVIRSLAQVLFAHLPGSNSGFEVLMGDDLIVLTTFQVSSQIGIPSLLCSVLRCLTLQVIVKWKETQTLGMRSFLKKFTETEILDDYSLIKIFPCSLF